MSVNSSLRLKIASPCRTSWTQMTGDERVRFCSLCKKNVYNLSTLSRDEAVGLVKAKEGELCAIFFQRADGTVMTSDCPVGVRRARFAMAAAISLLAVIFVAPVLGMKTPSGRSNWNGLVDEMRRVPVIGALVSWVSPERMMLGAVRRAP